MILFSIDEYESAGDFRRLSWAHALCDSGLAVSLIGSIMMACAQQTLPAAKAAAGRIVANPLGTTPVISGPYPSAAAAAAAANAIVSPKQHRNNGGIPSATSPQTKKQTSPYPTLESQSSPSRRRKSSGQGKQFAGVHNQGKHPPVFASQHVQEEWRAQQSGAWSEEQVRKD
nr:hypothetical protein BaRGS_006683 [Batillaria attramentaria]